MQNEYKVLIQSFLHNIQESEQIMSKSEQALDEARRTLYEDKKDYGFNFESMDTHKVLKQAKAEFLKAMKSKKDSQDILYNACLKYVQDMLKDYIFNADSKSLEDFLTKLMS